MIRYYTKGTDFSPKFITKINKWVKTFTKFKGYDRISLNYIFCSDDELLKINRQFLSHDYYTDIITFDTLEDQHVKKGSLSGDIFISVDTVSANSKTFDTTFDEELHRVMIHGVLHLIGFDDLTPEEQAEMRRQEDIALSMYHDQVL